MSVALLIKDSSADDEMGYGSVAESNELERALSELSAILDEAEATR